MSRYPAHTHGNQMLRFHSVSSLVTLLAITLILAGCDGADSGVGNSVSFATDYAPISFTFPNGWRLNPDDHPYDLQVLSKSEELNTAVFVFQNVDLATDSTPLDIFKMQIDDLRSKRDNFHELETSRISELGSKTITSHTLVGEKDAARMCYHFSLIEFSDDKTKFAVTNQIVRPSGWPEAKPVFEKIVSSAILGSKAN